MPVDYSIYTDIFDLKNGEAVMREYPEADAAALVTLKRGQKLRRLDTFYWNGAWVRFYADVQGGAKYEGYLHADDVAESALDEAPAQPAPEQQATSPPPLQPPPPVNAGPVPELALGCVDADVSKESCDAFLSVVKRTTGIAPADLPAMAKKVEKGVVVATAPSIEKLVLKHLPTLPDGVLSIARVQQILHDSGFFPGGKVDGIYGYRTRSAVRLFQEYVRSVERLRCTPDGSVGDETREHLLRWAGSGARATWASQPGEYDAWLALLQDVKQKYLTTPGRVLEKVNAFPRRTDTRKVQDWDFTGPGHIHLIGIRRKSTTSTPATIKSDDIFIALIKGLVFKFQGSTEPGSSEEGMERPYLTPGQHDYFFGWHQKSYLALRPRSDRGVLIIRAGENKVLDDSDVDRDLEANASINIHWGGRGLDGLVKGWSAGCQVISGSVYMRPDHHLEDCTSYAASDPYEAKITHTKTRGAYNVLSDLVIAYASDLPDDTVKYTLLNEEDLDLAPALRAILEDARAKVMEKVPR